MFASWPVRSSTTSQRPRLRAAVPVAIAAAVAALIAGCGGSSSAPAGHRSHDGGGASASRHHGSAVSPTEPIATQTVVQDINGGGSNYRFSIYDLRRDGPFLVLDFSGTCTSGTTANNACVESLVPQASLGPATGGTTHTDSEDASGVFLVDPVNNTAYYAVRDGADEAFTSNPAPDPSAGVTYYDWVRFPAPPANVTRIDVAFPDSDAVFSSVPITSRTSGPVPIKGGVVDPPTAFSQPPSSTNTAGLTLPVGPLALTTGTAAGYDLARGASRLVTLPSDVLFAFDKATLTSRAHAIIAAAAAEIKGEATGPVQITGYTDSIGPQSVNLPLSLHRADAVAQALAVLSPGVHYTSTGLGDADPVAPNTLASGADNPAGRALNRRVTISYSVKPPPPKPTPAPATSTSTSSGASGPTFTDDPGMDGEQYRETVESFVREGDLLLLRLSITCVRAGTGLSGCSQGNDMQAVSTIPPVAVGSDVADDNHLNAFMVEDTANGREGITPRDAYGNSVTTALDLQKVGQTLGAWIYFADPDPSASTLRLVAPFDTARVTVPVTDG